MAPRLVQVSLSHVFGEGAQHAHGWSLAEKHGAAIDAALSGDSEAPAGTVIVLDLEGVQSMSASYLKRILVWYLLAGERFVAGGNAGPEGPPALNIYPAIMNAAADVREEITVVLEHANMACWEVVNLDGGAIGRARLIGGIDRQGKQTLLRVVEVGEASAPLFHERFRGEQIGVTAWNYRLNELHARRLVWRDKRVRQFVFRPFVKEIVDG